MKIILILLMLICSVFHGFGQVVIGLKYVGKNPTIPVHPYSTTTKTCDTATTYLVGKNGCILVFRMVDDDNYAVFLEENDSGTTYATRNQNYCVAEEDIIDLFRPKGTVDHGVLAIPFKLRFNPVKVMAGGELGYYVGRRWGKSSAIFHAGFSTVALNDVNSTSTIPETKVGFTWGVGFVHRLSDDFQIGVIEGMDLFEGVEDWAYKFNPWLSVSIGYSFLKPNSKDVKAKKNQ